MKIEVRDCKTNKLLFSFSKCTNEECISHLKSRIQNKSKKLSIHRQSLRSSPRGKDIANGKRLADIIEGTELTLYLRDLGPQIGWRTVFLVEYTGPLFIYFTMWLLRQPFVPNPLMSPITSSLGLRRLAMACWCGHYIKRLFETIYIHHFSHDTMPLQNLYKNCSYYYGFTVFVSYFVNHPLYTPPRFGCAQICTGLAIFLISEWGNFSCHVVLRNLRPPGTTVRQIPKPAPNYVMTRLFNLVACPHYTYEVLSWYGFTIMTQAFPALLFATLGFLQMSTWAQARLRRYRSEFADYPSSWKAIVPFLY